MIEGEKKAQKGINMGKEKKTVGIKCRLSEKEVGINHAGITGKNVTRYLWDEFRDKKYSPFNFFESGKVGWMGRGSFWGFEIRVPSFDR